VRISDSEFRCDKCGGDCGNGGVASCVVVSDIDPDTGMVVNYHYCRDREEDGEKIKGCDKKVLSAANRKYYLEQKEKEAS
jgi:hypothetical protein